MTGKELRAIRDSFGERQVDFAKRLGLTSNHLARIERGEAAVTKTLELLAHLIAKGKRHATSTRRSSRS
jgi:transcriptional regulator with XRE-family HTH domain